MKVTKEVTFDCAHMLSGHKSLCKNLHGHTYKAQITVEGEQITEGSSLDMVIDFKDLKEAIDVVIMRVFDHATIISGADYRNGVEEELLQFVQKNKLRYVILPKRTTAEDMALFIKQDLTNYLVKVLNQEQIKNVTVCLYETPTSFAEV